MPLLLGYSIAKKSKEILRLMTNKFLEWYPSFTAVETQEDDTTHKFLMIADMDKGFLRSYKNNPI